LASQTIRPFSYAEPFAGGAGAALRLLVDEEVRTIYINDINPGIAAFWRCVFYHTEPLAAMIENSVASVDAWYGAQQIYESPADMEDLALGFATFFLNRCNRSGILDARPIGGLDQSGPWKIDARYNRDALAQRVRFLGGYRKRVLVSQEDARVFMRRLDSEAGKVMVYADPPYLAQGTDLYLDRLTIADHTELAALLLAAKFPWILTYDADESVVRKLYSGLRAAQFKIAHTAQLQHIGTEFAVFGPQLSIPNIDLLPEAAASWVR
jgi:DNA adenine methylase